MTEKEKTATALKIAFMKSPVMNSKMFNQLIDFILMPNAVQPETKPIVPPDKENGEIKK